MGGRTEWRNLSQRDKQRWRQNRKARLKKTPTGDGQNETAEQAYNNSPNINATPIIWDKDNELIPRTSLVATASSSLEAKMPTPIPPPDSNNNTTETTQPTTPGFFNLLIPTATDPSALLTLGEDCFDDFEHERGADIRTPCSETRPAHDVLDFTGLEQNHSYLISPPLTTLQLWSNSPIEGYFDTVDVGGEREAAAGGGIGGTGCRERGDEADEDNSGSGGPQYNIPPPSGGSNRMPPPSGGSSQTPHLRTTSGSSPMQPEARPESSSAAQENNLLDLPTRFTALHKGATYGHEEMVRLLIKSGANLDLRNHDGRTALHIATANGFVGIVNDLLAAGADIEAQDFAGERPLHLAASFGHSAVAQLLISKGARIDAFDGIGGTLGGGVRDGMGDGINAKESSKKNS